MTIRKPCNKYYFSVEGKTEKWYLEWLCQVINTDDNATHKININCKITDKPYKHAKTLTTITKTTEIYHLSDYESDDEMHERQFNKIIGEIQEANKNCKHIKYKFGYSNLTFELWIILHMISYNNPIAHRDNYLDAINRAYGGNFKRINDFKQENNFKYCLNKLKIENVISAVERAKYIMKLNSENHKLYEYKGFKYYKTNPSLMIFEPVEKILYEYGLSRPPFVLAFN